MNRPAPKHASPRISARRPRDAGAFPEINPDLDDRELLLQVVGYYHAALKESPAALSYLERRGLRSPEMVDRFRLGYANRTLSLRLPAKTTQAGARLRERLTQLGILRATGHEHFNGSLVVPVFDATGGVVEVYGRKVGDALRAGTPRHLFLNARPRGVWNLEALASAKEIILCQSLIDALTFWCAGYRGVTASHDVDGFTGDLLEALKRHGIGRVLIAYGRHEAGDRAAEDLGRKLNAGGMACLRIRFPQGMDVNSFALAEPPAQRSLGHLVDCAVCMEDSKEIGPPPAPIGAGPLPRQCEAGVEQRPDEITLRLEDRRYRVRGLSRNTSLALMRVNVLAARGEAIHADTLDLYSARHRQAFVSLAAVELGLKEEVVRKDIGKVLVNLEEIQEQRIRQSLEPEPKPGVPSDEAKAEALALLRDPDLLTRVLHDFEKCGVVGEETNKLVGYLAAVSRKLEEPLAVVIQSSSAAGKTLLMEAVLAFVPEEDRVKYSAMTGQSLYYLGGRDLRNKILAIVEQEGAGQASYALKLLQSERELTIASTGKDPGTGRLVTREYKVEGPVMILLTTTAAQIEEELLSRCLVLTVDEDREQTRAIHRTQREAETLQGLLTKQNRERVLQVHRNAQRLLKPLKVVNPYAPSLTFRDDRTRTRRDHLKYLTLIRAIALLHQHQREVKTVRQGDREVEYLEATLRDIEAANRLAHQVLGRCLDELAPQTRRLLILLEESAARACRDQGIDRDDLRFTRRQVREWIGWSYEQLRVHLARLVDLEYLLVHRGGRGRCFVYELLYDGKGKDGQPFMVGLADPRMLGEAGLARTTPASEAPSGGLGVRLGGHTGPLPGTSLVLENHASRCVPAGLNAALPVEPKKVHRGLVAIAAQSRRERE